MTSVLRILTKLQKKNKRYNRKRFAENTIAVISFLFILWVCASWINVLAHNDPDRGDRKYAPNNVFVMMDEKISK